MNPARLSVPLLTMLLAVALAALNFWLFRLSILLGIVGLNVTKHLAIAYLCHRLGVNRRGMTPTAAIRPPVGPSPN